MEYGSQKCREVTRLFFGIPVFITQPARLARGPSGSCSLTQASQPRLPLRAGSCISRKLTKTWTAWVLEALRREGTPVNPGWSTGGMSRVARGCWRLPCWVGAQGAGGGLVMTVIMTMMMKNTMRMRMMMMTKTTWDPSWYSQEQSSSPQHGPW